MSAPRNRLRAHRPAPARGRAARMIVPLALGALAVVALVIMALAAAVLLGVIPYPGR